ncbi:MAG: P-loop NTPase [Spirochaetales bacterium]|nr:P-loop NTPase [Spirochaetales bacterium]
MHILPIASGKGGVGKSLIAANLSIALAQSGKKVVLADLDLGASNLHQILGLGALKEGIGTFLANEKGEISDYLVNTNYDNLLFLPGDAEIPGVANLKAGQKNLIMKRFLQLDTEYLIIDLGAGSSYNTVDFFLSSGHGIIVTKPTLTATLNAYLFLKNSVFRIMMNSFHKGTKARERFNELMHDSTSIQKVYIPRLVAEISKFDPESYANFREKIGMFHPRLILNMLEDPRDSGKAGKIRRSCREYLDIDMEHLGIIYRDHLQDIALNSRLPIIAYKPQAILSQAIYRIADKIINISDEDAGFLTLQELDESYQTADLEAEVDYQVRVHDLENLLHSGALTRGDLIETVKTQQFEINSLKRENQLIKSKLLKAAEEGFRV